MSIPPIPPPLEHLGSRKFSFYPPILNIESNEWRYLKATWSEILVANLHSNQEIWVPRRFLGEVSRIDDPVLIVGLNKELEFSMGRVWPHRRHVIEMPVAVNQGPSPMPARPSEQKGPAAVVGIRLESTDAKAGKMVIGLVAVAVVGCLVLAMIARQSQFHQRVAYTSHDQSYFGLGHDDDYYAVTRALGSPASERSSPESGSIQFRALLYPKRGYTVILFGKDRKSLLYIGAIDEQCNPIHSISYSDGTSSGAMLRNIGRMIGCSMK